jgi:hypothetical protein
MPHEVEAEVARHRGRCGTTSALVLGCPSAVRPFSKARLFEKLLDELTATARHRRDVGDTARTRRRPMSRDRPRRCRDVEMPMSPISGTLPRDIGADAVPPTWHRPPADGADVMPSGVHGLCRVSPKMLNNEGHFAPTSRHRRRSHRFVNVADVAPMEAMSGPFITLVSRRVL